MRWLLDTNVVSETVRPHADKAVLSWIALQAPQLVAASSVTIAELRVGIQLSADPRRREQLSRWVDEEVPAWFEDRLLPVTTSILCDWIMIGRMLAARGVTRNPADLLIAATARIYNLIVVSRNVRDFADTGVNVYDPWNRKTHRMDQP